MPLEALIFDVDGTLAETEELHRRSFNESFRLHQVGWEWDEALYAELLQTTGGRERIVRYVEDFAPGDKHVLDNLPALHKTKTQSYLALLQQGALPLRPGVARLIHEARAARFKLAIATTSNPKNVKALLRGALGVESPGWFTIAAGDIAPRKKPSPDVYYQALEALDVGPAHAIAFEDSTNGLRAALAAGLAVVATPSHFLSGENLDGALSIVSDLGEPGRPLRHLAGSHFAKGFVDLEGLEAVFSARYCGGKA